MPEECGHVVFELGFLCFSQKSLTQDKERKEMSLRAARVPVPSSQENAAAAACNDDADAAAAANGAPRTSAEGFVDPAVVSLIPFMPRPADSTSDRTTFWGNPVVRSVMKYDGVITGTVAGLVVRFPNFNLVRQLATDGHILSCRLASSCRVYFERDNADRMLGQADDGHEVLYHMVLHRTEAGVGSHSVLKLLVEYQLPGMPPPTTWHVTSHDLLEIDRSGINVCSYLDADRERSPFPLSGIIMDLNRQQYDFLNAPKSMPRPHVWQRRYHHWKHKLRTDCLNKARTWEYLNPAKVAKDWTCSICLERPGRFCSYLMKLSCGHVFHPDCFCNVSPVDADTPSAIRCPMCRAEHCILEL